MILVRLVQQLNVASFVRSNDIRSGDHMMKVGMGRKHTVGVAATLRNTAISEP
jgi:hypothetical protein